MKRDTTNRINKFLDDWVPPRIRDSKLLVTILFGLLFGKKSIYYMHFKDELPNLSEKEINKYYKVLHDTFINRDTDCNQKCIDRIIRETEGIKVLDVAGGKGYMANQLYQRDSRLECTVSDIVLPIEKDCIRGIEYVQATITHLPFADDAFDTVICTHALEHLKDVDVALSEIRRVCRKKLIIALPRQREYKYTCDLHLRFFPYKYNVESLIKRNSCSKIKESQVFLLSNDWLIIERMDSDNL